MFFNTQQRKAAAESQLRLPVRYPLRKYFAEVDARRHPGSAEEAAPAIVRISEDSSRQHHSRSSQRTVII
jgi:hypothetical protein